MRVPVENIYYLLCYAHKHLPDNSFVPSSAELGHRTENLFAHILSAGVRRLLRKGIAKRYLERREELRGVRGKIRLSETLSRGLLLRGRLACQFTELTVDIPENRILKAALKALVVHPRVSDKYKKELAETWRMLANVGDEALLPANFAALHRHPPRQDYSHLLGVARLLADGALPHPAADERRFIEFEASEARMGTLFEKFIKGFLEVEVPEVVHLSRSGRWDVEADDTARRLLPGIEHDVPILLNGEHIIVECKFYKEPLVGRFGGQKIHSAHLYQLYAYLMNDKPETKGLLLYAAVGRNFDVQYRLKGRDVRVCTIKLDQPWQGIHDAMLGVFGVEQGRALGARAS